MSHHRPLTTPSLIAALLLLLMPTPSGAGNPAAAPSVPRPDDLAVGQPAPDFDYLSTPYGWRRFRDECAQRPVLLVIAPSEADLVALERDRAALAIRGVTPMAVLRRRDGENWKTISRLKLGFALFSDPHGVVPVLFDVRDSATGESEPAWFLVARGGGLLAFARGELPADGFARVVAAALPRAATTVAADSRR